MRAFSLFVLLCLFSAVAYGQAIPTPPEIRNVEFSRTWIVQADGQIRETVSVRCEFKWADKQARWTLETSPSASSWLPLDCGTFPTSSNGLWVPFATTATNTQRIPGPTWCRISLTNVPYGNTASAIRQVLPPGP